MRSAVVVELAGELLALLRQGFGNVYSGLCHALGQRVASAGNRLGDIGARLVQLSLISVPRSDRSTSRASPVPLRAWETSVDLSVMAETISVPCVRIFSATVDPVSDMRRVMVVLISVRLPVTLVPISRSSVVMEPPVSARLLVTSEPKFPPIVGQRLTGSLRCFR